MLLLERRVLNENTILIYPNTPQKAQVYKDPRPKEYFDRFHERSRTRDPDWVYEAVRIVTTRRGRQIAGNPQGCIRGRDCDGHARISRRRAVHRTTA